MPQSGSNSGSTFDHRIDRLVSADKLRLLYHQSFPALFVSVVVAGLLCLMLWGQVPPYALIGWLVVIFVCALLRLGLFIAYFRTRPGSENLRLWERPFAVTLMLSSLTWGIGAIIVMPEESLVHQVVVMYVMIGLAGGAISTYSAYRYMAVGSMLSLLLPPAVWMLFEGGVIPLSLAATSFIFILASLRATGVLATALHRSFQLTHELEGARAAFEEQAKTDVLTGLNNRRALFDQGARLLSYCERNQLTLSAILLDVDHFKKINDSHGHAVGDAALQHLARLLQSSSRRSDLCGRIGGEEFALLLPDTHLQAACVLAEKLRQTVMDSPLLYQGETYALTISLGVSSSDGGLDALIHRADLALYKAKAQGRNRIECASEEGARSYMAMRSSSS
jgi:diguanylate cyclase (GGDEF)-like protein